MVQHLSVQLTIADGHCIPGTKQNVAKCPAIFPQGKLGIGSAIQIVEHRLGKPALRQTAQIFDIDDP
jgi:hypothetical protein